MCSKLKSNLSHIELLVYFSIWVLINFYLLLRLFLSLESLLDLLLKTNYDDSYEELELKPGWSFTKRLQDVSDIEWSCMKYLIRTNCWQLVLNFVVSEVLRRTYQCLLKYWYIVSAILYITLNFGIQQLCILLFQPVLFALIIFSAGGKKCVWATSILLLFSYNYMDFKNIFWSIFDEVNQKDEEVYLLLFALPWTELRCISYSIDYLNKMANNKEPKNFKWEKIFQNIIDMFSYVLYAPLLYTGPIVLYEEFERSFSVEIVPITPKVKRFICDMILFLFYTFLLDLSLHYIYFYALNKYVQILSDLSLCGGGLWMGVVFHMKYVVSYGTTCAFTRLDNIDAPPTPRCIARIHAYSQMWKYFDVGLYKFLVKYIYRPGYEIISNRLKLPKMIYKLSASLLTFTFALLWHGVKRSILIWTALNFFGLTAEHIAETLSKTEKYRWFKNYILRTEQMETRFKAVLYALLLYVSAISNFYLFAGSFVGDCYVKRFVFPCLNTFLTAVLILYCTCQVGMALNDFPSRTDVKNITVKKNDFKSLVKPNGPPINHKKIKEH